LLLVGPLVDVCDTQEEGEEGVARVDACDFGVCGSEDEEDCWDLNLAKIQSALHIYTHLLEFGREGGGVWLARTNPRIAAPLLKILCPKLGMLSIMHLNASLQCSCSTIVSRVKVELARHVSRPVVAVPG
jgi:hypothetical protein